MVNGFCVNSNPFAPGPPPRGTPDIGYMLWVVNDGSDPNNPPVPGQNPIYEWDGLRWVQLDVNAVPQYMLCTGNTNNSGNIEDGIIYRTFLTPYILDSYFALAIPSSINPSTNPYYLSSPTNFDPTQPARKQNSPVYQLQSIINTDPSGPSDPNYNDYNHAVWALTTLRMFQVGSITEGTCATCSNSTDPNCSADPTGSAIFGDYWLNIDSGIVYTFTLNSTWKPVANNKYPFYYSCTASNVTSDIGVIYFVGTDNSVKPLANLLDAKAGDLLSARLASTNGKVVYKLESDGTWQNPGPVCN